MAGSTINKMVTVGVTLGSAGYASPLTITGVGEIAPVAGGAIALYADVGAGYVLNHGHIVGGTGVTGTTGSEAGIGGGTGGSGVDLQAGSLTTDGTIAGGAGGGGGAGSGEFGIGGARRCRGQRCGSRGRQPGQQQRDHWRRRRQRRWRRS